MLRLLVFAAFTTALAAPSGTITARAPARCVARDDNGGALLSSSITSDGFVACDYQNAGHCEYFTPGGQFSSGSSVCPDSITPGSKRSVERSTLSARAPARCVARDDNGGALLSSSITADGFVACNYQNAGHCEYFTPGGQFSSGSSVCPDSITPGSKRSVEHSTLSARAPARCVARDDNGGALLSSSITSDGFVACNYQDAGHCEYFTPGGQFSSGSSVCPDSITPGSKRSIEAPKLSARAPARCVARDDNGGALLSSSVTADGFVACNYQNAGHCEYFTPGGQFSSGSSVCPDSITPGSK